MKISNITCLCMLILLALSSYEGLSAQDKPNVIIVMSDDFALPIVQARIFISDANLLTADEKRAYGFEGLARAVKPGETSATFTIPLEAGPMALHTWFDDEKAETICSAYYVFVRRL